MFEKILLCFEKSLLKVSSDFINNIDDDCKRNLWKDSSMIFKENHINAHIRKSLLKLSKNFSQKHRIIFSKISFTIIINKVAGNFKNMFLKDFLYEH